jgi:hypothetical protein
MTARRVLVVAVAATLLRPGSGPAAATAQAPQETPRFKTGSEVVILDVVIRDKKGRTLRDVTPGRACGARGRHSAADPVAAAASGGGGARRSHGEEPPADQAGPRPQAPHAGPAGAVDSRHVNLVTLVFRPARRRRPRRSRARRAWRSPASPRRASFWSRFSRSGSGWASCSSSRPIRRSSSAGCARRPGEVAHAVRERDRDAPARGESARRRPGRRFEALGAVAGASQARHAGLARPRGGHGAHGRRRAAASPTRCSASSRAAPRSTRCSRSHASSSAWPGARRSCSSPRASRSRPTSSTCSTRRLARRTARTSASTRSTRAG